jgi:hypothetical protein
VEIPTFNEMLVSTYGVVCLTVALSALLYRELCIVVYCNAEEITRYKRGEYDGGVGVVWGWEGVVFFL